MLGFELGTDVCLPILTVDNNRLPFPMRGQWANAIHAMSLSKRFHINYPVINKKNKLTCTLGLCCATNLVCSCHNTNLLSFSHVVVSCSYLVFWLFLAANTCIKFSKLGFPTHSDNQQIIKLPYLIVQIRLSRQLVDAVSREGTAGDTVLLSIAGAGLPDLSR